MSFLTNLLAKVGAVVDAAVPFAVGARTKLAVLACPILGSAVFVSAVTAAYPPAAAVLPYVQAAFCTAAPLFALAGLVRKP